MNLKKLFMSLVTLLMVVPVFARAASNITIECDKTIVKPNSTFTCTLKGTSDKKITTIGAHLTFGENLSLVSAEVNEDWMGDAENGEYDLTAEAYPYPTGTFTIGTFTVKAGDVKNGFDSSISIAGPIFADETFEDITLSDVSKSIRIGSTINTLSRLVVGGKELDLTKALNTEVNADSVEISATATDQKAKITGTGKHTLKYGTNTISVKVTSESGDVKEYKVNVNRPDNRSTDNSLAYIKINGENIDLTKELKFETYDDKVTIEAAAKDAKAIVSGSLGEHTLKDGENTFVIKVKAENESEKAYSITINKIKKDNTVNPDNNQNKPSENEPDQPLDEGPQTGIVYPIIIMTSICLIVFGAYLIIKNKNKLFKI